MYQGWSCLKRWLPVRQDSSQVRASLVRVGAGDVMSQEAEVDRDSNWLLELKETGAGMHREQEFLADGSVVQEGTGSMVEVQRNE